MRDVKAGRDIKVEGDMIISDNLNQEIKPLRLYSSEELRNEHSHRCKLLKAERKTKTSRICFFLSIAVIVGIGISVWYMINGKVQLAMFAVAIVGFMMPIIGAVTNLEPTEFEKRQLDVLKEIGYLVKERKSKNTENK